MADELPHNGTERFSRFKSAFQLTFTYRLLHQKRKLIHAIGDFACLVNPYMQTLDYKLDLQSDMLSRPYSESYSILFSKVYEEIPPQRISIAQYPMLRLKYPVPIYYDWEAFMIDGMRQAVQRKKIQALLRNYRLEGVAGQQIDADLQVVDIILNEKYAAK